MSRQTRFRVTQMTCQNCVRHVTRTLSSLQGVSRVEVSLEKGTATIQSDAPVTLETVRAALADEGYGVESGDGPASPVFHEKAPVTGEPSDGSLDSGLRRTAFGVEGMHCATCVFTIEQALRKEDGIGRVNVNLATQTCDLTFDPRQVSLDRIYSVVRETGYTPRPSSAEESRREFQKELRGFLATGALAIPLLLLPGSAPPAVFLAVSFALQAVGGGTFYRGAWNALRHTSANMDTLVALGTTAAFAYSVFHVLGFTPDSMFMTQSLLLLFIRFGKLLEARVRERARALLGESLSLLPETVTVASSENGGIRSLPLSEVSPGTRVFVAKGERIPADGTLDGDETWLDLSLVTGESVPARVERGEGLIGGTVNVGSPIAMIVTASGRETFLSRLVSMIREAQGDKPPIQRLADRVASLFVPGVIGTSMVAFGLFELFTGDHRLSVMALVGVLVVACPCALGLATPTAVLVGSAKALKRGVLFKRGEVLETLSKTTIVAFDKTGTLTLGALSEITWIPARPEEPADPLLNARISFMARHSRHPASRALAESLSVHGGPEENARIEEVPGKGVSAEFRGNAPAAITIGSLPYLAGEGIPVPDPGKDIGLVVGVGENKMFRGLFRLVDRERSEAPAVIRYFRDRGIKVALLSGDRREEAVRVARMSGIPEEDVFAPVSPAEKRTRIQNWQREGQIVSMVGDGINDAASLAQADIGISMTNAAGLTQDKGDILLLGNNLEQLVTAHKASLATMDKIRQNLGWAFLYNIAGIPLAGGVLYPFWHIFIPPYASGLAMALSSVSVVTNSLLLSFPAPRSPQGRADKSA
jgi:Cu+-exporting ATPase